MILYCRLFSLSRLPNLEYSFAINYYLRGRSTPVVSKLMRLAHNLSSTSCCSFIYAVILCGGSHTHNRLYIFWDVGIIIKNITNEYLI